MRRRYITEAESLGYQKPKPKPPKRIFKKFSSKREKWEFMKARNLDSIYLNVKDIFGDVGEPEIYPAELQPKPQQI